MFMKIIIMLFGAALLFESSNAAAFRDEDSALHALVNRLELLKFTETEQYPIDKDILKKGTLVMEKVLKDPKVLAIDTPVMKVRLDEIRNFVEEYDKFEKRGAPINEMFRYEDKYDMIIDKYYKSVEDIKEDKAISESFKDNGFERLDKETVERLNEFMDKLIVELQKCIDSMDETEKKEDKSIIEFMKELKAESDTEKRDTLIWRFFGLIKLDDFLW